MHQCVAAQDSNAGGGQHTQPDRTCQAGQQQDTDQGREHRAVRQEYDRGQGRRLLQQEIATREQAQHDQAAAEHEQVGLNQNDASNHRGARNTATGLTAPWHGARVGAEADNIGIMGLRDVVRYQRYAEPLAPEL